MWRLFAGFAAALALSGCAGNNEESGGVVVTAFYPLAWAAERVGGEGTDVVNLTPAGAEPHDLELSPRDVETIEDAALVLYVGGGFQPAVEDAVRSRDGVSLDVSEGDRDPHIWLDPPRFAEITRALGRELGRQERAEALARELTTLDASYRAGLRSCERRVLVTAHTAFAHLANRYGIEQVSLAGASPEAEPGPQELEELVAAVQATGATTLFAEPLVSDRLARTIAREADVELAVLDPLEGFPQERLDAGDDYLSVMRDNLDALREALGCR